MKEPDLNLVAFGRRIRRIRELADVSLSQLFSETRIPKAWMSRLETGKLKINPHRVDDWGRIMAMVEWLRSRTQALYDPRDVYRLVCLLGRAPTVDEMYRMCPNVDYETLQQQVWLRWPTTMPWLKQPVVMRKVEWQWLWEHVIPIEDFTPVATTATSRIDAAIVGAPGMGKSTLALMFGSSAAVATHFPDGVLYASQQAADARVWLAQWAEQYSLELSKSGAAVLWRDALRTRLKGLAVLVILDDVRDPSFAESLLVVDSLHSRVVMTTRRFDLPAKVGIAPDRILDVQPMTVEQGVELLQMYVPKGTWTDKDDKTARQVIDKLGGAPHAIGIVGQHIAQAEPGQRDMRWQGTLRRLSRDRLTPLEGVRATYDEAYADLQELQAAYRVLGAGAWGAPMDDGWVTALRAVPEQQARSEILELASQGLIAQHSDDEMRLWYQAHVLIGEHAASQMNKSERALYAERHARYFARLLLSAVASKMWQRMPIGLPHVDQLRQAAAWCADHLDTPEHILLAQAIYLGASGRIALGGKLKDTLPLGEVLCDLQMPGRVSGCVLWTHGRALLDVGKAADASRLLERGGQVLFECGDLPAAVCCLTDSSTAYHEAGQREAAKRTAKLGNGWATAHEAEIDAILTVKDLNRARQDRRLLGQVNAVLEVPDQPSPLFIVAVRRMCVLNAKRLAAEVAGRPMTVRRRPIGRLPWQPEDLVYAVTIRQVAESLLTGLEGLSGRTANETGQA